MVSMRLVDAVIFIFSLSNQFKSPAKVGRSEASSQWETRVHHHPVVSNEGLKYSHPSVMIVTGFYFNSDRTLLPKRDESY